MFYHLAPGLLARQTAEKHWSLYRDPVEFARIVFQLDGHVSVRPTGYHAEFGRSDVNQTIVVSYIGKIPTEILTEIIFI